MGIPTLLMTVTRPVNVRIAWLISVTLFLVATTSTLAGHGRVVTHQYRAASQRWLERAPLYTDTCQPESTVFCYGRQILWRRFATNGAYVVRKLVFTA